MSDFGVDRTAVRAAFSRAASSYDAYAVLQRQIGVALIERAARLATWGAAATVLDVGAGTGGLTQALAERLQPGCMIALDSALGMARECHARRPLGGRIFALCADAEKLPVRAASADLLFSNFALQWCGLRKAFCEAYRVLLPSGWLVVSLPGEATLAELKAAWRVVDDAQHVHDFPSLLNLETVLEAVGFGELVVQSRVVPVEYASGHALMASLKGVGASNRALGRPRHLFTPRQLERVLAAYPCESGGQRVMATYEVLTAVARRPA